MPQHDIILSRRDLPRFLTAGGAVTCGAHKRQADQSAAADADEPATHGCAHGRTWPAQVAARAWAGSKPGAWRV
jgi:hypothetical protein